MLSREAELQEQGRGIAQAPVTGAGGRPQDERRVVAWVGKSVVFKGELSSSEDMTIDGRVEGSINVREHTLIIGPDADIRADITAATVTIFGAVHGSITARDKVDVRHTGSVEGDITSARLAVVEGAVLKGRVGTKTRTPRPEK
ncbi:MAG: polymer-forming cytoskeletal protein [Acidobacteria bacterium]|nr:polymer-forming cytoskeletal protein [Acidobacteriota bacterium]